MEQRSLRVVETNKTFFSKITNTLTKMLIPTKVGFNSIMINIKRNALIKNYSLYKSASENEDITKKEVYSQKYEDSYALYLEAIDKYIIDSVYKKVKNNTATNFEKDALSKYYLIVSLKDRNYLEYKYKKQEYLLKVDYNSASNIKKEAILEKYKIFYIDKMDSIYKGLLKNYSINIADNSKKSEEIYDKVFNILETYVSDILPIKMEQDKEEALAKDYETYENSIIGKLNSNDIIMKKVNLLNISRHIFTHSFPLLATEKCYMKLIKDTRDLILGAPNEVKRNKAYDTLFSILQEYHDKILSTKIYWEVPTDKEKHKKFWSKYQNAQTQDKKNALLLQYDLKSLQSSKDSKIYRLYKDKLVEMGEIRRIKKYTNKYDNKYKAKSVKV